jgi:hypothetical protein
VSELGSSAAVGIESVEWLDAGGGQLTVRVTGRWRRRRGWVESRGPTMLVIEAEGRRQRFPATPEPPSLGGAAPGTWRLSFTVPAGLAHGLSGHVWLALGTVTVPLPVPESAAGPAAPEASSQTPPDPAPAAPEAPDSSPARSEREPGPLEIERAWRRADAAERTAGELGERVTALERALERERADRAMQAARVETERERSETERLETERLETERLEPDELAAAERDRLRAERALRAARRGADVRVPAEPPTPPALPVPSAPPPAGQVTAPAGPQSAGAERPAGGPGPARPAGAEADPVRLGESDTISALRRELGARAAGEAALRARTVQAETRLAVRVLLEQRTTAALEELRTELGRLQDALERERSRRHAAEEAAARLRAELASQRERSRDAHAAIQELRSAIELLRPSPPPTAGSVPPSTAAGGAPPFPAAGGAPPPPAAGSAPTGAHPPPGGEVTPDRLSDALARLRQNAEPREEESGWEAAGEPPAPAAIVPTVAFQRPPSAQAPLPATPALPSTLARPGTLTAPAPVPLPAGVAGPTVEQPFRRLVDRDAERGGRLLIGLLGGQRAAWPHAVAYDLVLGPGYGTVQVTVGERGVSVERAGSGRAREDVVFQIIGAPARLARLFTAGPLRRLLRVGLARVRGRREGVSALRALLSLPLDLGALRDAGVALDSETLFTLLAAMIEPGWTDGERFTISHTDERGHEVFLQVCDGQPPLVSLEPPAGRIATELSGSAAGLWQSFADGGPRPDASPGVAVRGDLGPLAVVRAWANRAQSGHGTR